jgi:Kef-type K+ transport system membrane component KefB
MLKKILTNHFVIVGIVVFLLLFFVGIFGISLSWGEALLLAAVITAVSIGTMWWQDFWPL